MLNGKNGYSFVEFILKSGAISSGNEVIVTLV